LGSAAAATKIMETSLSAMECKAFELMHLAARKHGCPVFRFLFWADHTPPHDAPFFDLKLMILAVFYIAALTGGKRKNVGPDGSMEKKSKNVPDDPNMGYHALGLSAQMGGGGIMMPLVGNMDPGMMSQPSVSNQVTQTYMAAQAQQMNVTDTDHTGGYVVASLAGRGGHPSVIAAAEPSLDSSDARQRQAGKQHRRTSLWNAFLSHKYKIRDTNEPYADFVKKVKIEWEQMSDEQKQVYANLAAEITAARYMYG